MSSPRVNRAIVETLEWLGVVLFMVMLWLLVHMDPYQVQTRDRVENLERKVQEQEAK